MFLGLQEQMPINSHFLFKAIRGEVGCGGTVHPVFAWRDASVIAADIEVDVNR